MKTIITERLSYPETESGSHAKDLSCDGNIPSWYCIADSALVNSGKPFFIPEFSDEFEAFLAPVVRIRRIGKTIEARFAPRYYSEIAPGIHIRASRLREELRKNGLPLDPSHNFDRSLTVGEFLPLDCFSGENTLVFSKNGEKIAEWKQETSHTSSKTGEIDKIIERVSKTNTMKMGDLIIPGLYGPSEIKIGDRLSVTLNDKEVLYLLIK